MNWFSKIFKKRQLSQADKEFFDGYREFAAGEKLYREVHSFTQTGRNEIKINTNKEKDLEALNHFDKAIEKGFDESIVFSLRGNILDSLGYYFEALEDYNLAILKKPTQGVADNYYRRSWVKTMILDYEGSLADLKEAIRLSQLNNDDNRYWNAGYQKIGYKTATDYYKGDLRGREMDVDFEKKHPSDKTADLKKIKRREQKTDLENNSLWK